MGEMYPEIRKSILVVEDDEEFRNALADLLRSAGWSVIEVGNATQALESLARLSFDAIVTDIVMPERDGIDLIMNIRNRISPRPVLIAMSGNSAQSPVYLRCAQLLGAQKVLLKPFSPADFMICLNESVRQRTG